MAVSRGNNTAILDWVKGETSILHLLRRRNNTAILDWVKGKE